MIFLGDVISKEIEFNIYKFLNEISDLFLNKMTVKNVDIYFFVDPSVSHDVYGNYHRIKENLISILDNLILSHSLGRIAVSLMEEDFNVEQVTLKFEVHGEFQLFEKNINGSKVDLSGVELDIPDNKLVNEGINDEVFIECRSENGVTLAFRSAMRNISHALNTKKLLGKKIVLFSDNDFLNQKLMSTLCLNGAEVFCAKNVSSCRSIIEGFDIDCVIIDDYSNLNIKETHEIIRVGYKEIKTLLLKSLNKTDTDIESNYVLIKPYNQNDLFDCLND